MLDLLLQSCRLLDQEDRPDVGIAGGRIAAIGPALGPARETVDVGGRVVTPGLVEAHIHLDKALLAGRVRATAGTLDEAIRLTGDAKRRFTVDDIRARARRALEMAVEAGTTTVRTHVEVDPIVGLMGMEAVLPLRDEFAPAVDLQICAFAQEGIARAPGTEALLRRALAAGAQVIGGCPYNDSDARRHIDAVFDLAAEFGVAADFHADFADEPDHLHIAEIVEQTLRRGWQGRVAVGHLTELAALPPPQQDGVIAGIAAARIGVVSLPMTDLYLMGRRDTHNVRRGLAPIRRLLDAGVPVALATNNVQNPFTPVGTADLVHLAYFSAAAAHMGSPEDLRALLDCITRHPAAILGIPDHGVAPGCRADLAVWECRHPEELIAGVARRALVIKAGRVSLESEHRAHARWRLASSTPAAAPAPHRD